MELLADAQEEAEDEEEEEEELEIQLKNKDVEVLCNAAMHNRLALPQQSFAISYEQIVAMVLDEFERNEIEVLVVRDGANQPLKKATLELRRQQKEKQKKKQK